MTEQTKTALVLRACAADMTSHNGFRWPESGAVEAPDWDPEPVCGGGLHGLLWGEGDGSLLSWEPDAKWLVAEIRDGSWVDLDGKVKFPRCEVVFCGDRKGATDYIAARAPGRSIVGGTATAGEGGILSVRWWDGRRYRIGTFYVGEDGIEPNTRYRCENGKAIKVESAKKPEAA